LWNGMGILGGRTVLRGGGRGARAMRGVGGGGGVRFEGGVFVVVVVGAVRWLLAGWRIGRA